jgi:hypothetical protein
MVPYSQEAMTIMAQFQSILILIILVNRSLN